MTRHISDSERLTQAMLNRKETELTEKEREIKNYQAQLRALTAHITELKESNKILCAQIQYLISKRTSSWN